VLNHTYKGIILGGHILLHPGLKQIVMENKVVGRFLRYVRYNTCSDSTSGKTPSSAGQTEFALTLAEELKNIGLQDVEADDFGYVYATLPANMEGSRHVVGFIAHMDTSPEFSGLNVTPRIIESYPGGDIVLDESKNILLSPALFPELNNYIGQRLIVTNGHTLLGADDKAGIAEIITAMEYLINQKDIKHGKVKVAFTPDEEIGEGANHFDVGKFGADFAYTVDGGELQFENFNASGAKVFIQGSSVHPGYSKGKMKNAILIANQLITMLPPHEVPEQTEGYEGFYHLVRLNGSVERAEMEFILRDFTREGMDKRKLLLQTIVKLINSEFGDGTAEIASSDQYLNMHQKIEPVKYIVEIAAEAIHGSGIEPKIVPIRGGTDGARLSYMGLPCPNIFEGGHNFHGKFEYIPTRSMAKACEVIVKIVEKVGSMAIGVH
jgi:tripeptide aminopeptidase